MRQNVVKIAECTIGAAYCAGKREYWCVLLDMPTHGIEISPQFRTKRQAEQWLSRLRKSLKGEHYNIKTTFVVSLNALSTAIRAKMA